MFDYADDEFYVRPRTVILYAVLLAALTIIGCFATAEDAGDARPGDYVTDSLNAVNQP